MEWISETGKRSIHSYTSSIGRAERIERSVGKVREANRADERTLLVGELLLDCTISPLYDQSLCTLWSSSVAQFIYRRVGKGFREGKGVGCSFWTMFYYVLRNPSRHFAAAVTHSLTYCTHAFTASLFTNNFSFLFLSFELFPFNQHSLPCLFFVSLSLYFSISISLFHIHLYDSIHNQIFLLWTTCFNDRHTTHEFLLSL